LKRTGILDLFDFAVGYDSGHGTKPARHGAGVLRGARIEAGEIAVVGDALHDLAMGRAATWA
jgi:phosphoglycolate phosphatase